jgi:hypothetical protein
MCASFTNSSHGSRKCWRHRCGATTCEQVITTLLLPLLPWPPLLSLQSCGDGVRMQKAVPRLSSSYSVMPCLIVDG